MGSGIDDAVEVYVDTDEIVPERRDDGPREVHNRQPRRRRRRTRLMRSDIDTVEVNVDTGDNVNDDNDDDQTDRDDINRDADTIYNTIDEPTEDTEASTNETIVSVDVNEDEEDNSLDDAGPATAGNTNTNETTTPINGDPTSILGQHHP